ncbi:MAG: ATP-dependent DNA helicase RecG, partial [Burkholderiaceae bacterium]
MPPRAIRAAATPEATPRAKSAPQRALEKLGLFRDIDLALHLPLRYEDETSVTPIGELRDGSVAQVEGVVRDNQIQTRARRQLIVRIHDGSDDLVLRFLHFYASTQKSLAVGQRVRVRGEARGGLFGLEMVHPSVKRIDADTPLPRALTPVYPSSAQLPQTYLRKVVTSALSRADLSELLPAGVAPARLMPLRAALSFLHHPDPQTPLATLQDRNHPAWQRLKFDELLA